MPSDELQLWENLCDSEIRRGIHALRDLGEPSTAEALCVKSALEEELWAHSGKIYPKCRKAYAAVDKTIDAILKSSPPRATRKDLERRGDAVTGLQRKEMGSPLKKQYFPKVLRGAEISKEIEQVIQGSVHCQTDIMFCAAKLARETAELEGYLKRMGPEFDPLLFRWICLQTQCVSFLLHTMYNSQDLLHTNQLRFRSLGEDIARRLEAGTKLDAKSRQASDKLLTARDWFDRMVAGKVTEEMLEHTSYIG